MKFINEFKLSIYNIVLDERNENVFIWNTHSNSIVKLEAGLYKLLQKECLKIEELGQYSTSLLKQGIIVPKKYDEFNHILANLKREQWRVDFKTLSLVVAPTLSCNFQCRYCFESDFRDQYIMDDKVINSLTSFVKKQLTSNSSIKRLQINWFGGEPLLAFNQVMVPLTKMLNSLCEERNVIYEASLTTNGFYLVPEILHSIINDLKINNFQITMDGTEKTYIKVKQTDRNAYSRVMHNLLSLANYCKNIEGEIGIALRLNANKKNIDDLMNLVTEIKSSKDWSENIKFYLGRIYSNDQSDFSIEEFEEASDEFMKFCNYKSEFPQPKTIWCSQHSLNSLCVGPHGELYKCEHYFGQADKVIGNIFYGLDYPTAFMNFMDIPINAKCGDCIIFPLCLGGCPQKRLASKGKYFCEFTINHLIKKMQTKITNY